MHATDAAHTDTVLPDRPPHHAVAYTFLEREQQDIDHHAAESFDPVIGQRFCMILSLLDTFHVLLSSRLRLPGTAFASYAFAMPEAVKPF